MTFDTPILQLISYIALTCASVTVAAVSCYTAYRQHRGWRPVVLVTTRSRTRIPSTDQHGFFIAFEVWNRRKYPIVLNDVEILFNRYEFLDMPGMENDPEHGITLPQGNSTLWFRDGREYTTYPSKLLASNEHSSFHIDAPYQFENKTKAAKVAARIEVRYFDPIRNRHATVKSRTSL
jgi:hypothetical protein